MGGAEERMDLSSSFTQEATLIVKMELQNGFKLLLQQYKALFTKNLLLAWRNKRATFLQLFSSIFFIFLLFVFQKATNAQFGTSTAVKAVRDPEPLIVSMYKGHISLFLYVQLVKKFVRQLVSLLLHRLA